MSFLFGGVYGDLKEGFGNIAECICCLMCSGPVLVCIGVYLFFTSFSGDPRLTKIGEYNTAVGSWNEGPGSDSSFQNLEFAALLSSTVASTSLLLGSKAPESVGDTSQRSEESFKEVERPWFYTTVGGGNGTLGSVQVNSALSAKSTQVTLQFGGSAVSSTSISKFYPVVEVDTPYRWYISRSSSRGSSSIDCRDPSYDYPGTRFAKVPSCERWCTNLGNKWMDNGRCFTGTSTARKATGCCMSLWAAKKACFQANPASKAGKFALSGKGCETSFSPGTNIGSNTATYDSKSFASDDGIGGSDSGGLSNNLGQIPILYAKMASESQWQGADMEISIRHSLDPYIKASALTGGCSSGTSSRQPKYTTSFELPPVDARCFGLTPGETREIAFMVIGVGAVLCIFPCAVIFYMKSKSKDRQPSQRYAQQPVGGMAYQGGPKPMMVSGGGYPVQQGMYPPQQATVVQAQQMPIAQATVVQSRY